MRGLKVAAAALVVTVFSGGAGWAQDKPRLTIVVGEFSSIDGGFNVDGARNIIGGRMKHLGVLIRERHGAAEYADAIKAVRMDVGIDDPPPTGSDANAPSRVLLSGDLQRKQKGFRARSSIRFDNLGGGNLPATFDDVIADYHLSAPAEPDMNLFIVGYALLLEAERNDRTKLLCPLLRTLTHIYGEVKQDGRFPNLERVRKNIGTIAARAAKNRAILAGQHCWNA